MQKQAQVPAKPLRKFFLLSDVANKQYKKEVKKKEEPPFPLRVLTMGWINIWGPWSTPIEYYKFKTGWKLIRRKKQHF